jgi:predicted AAA+ superfamily ATPase
MKKEIFKVLITNFLERKLPDTFSREVSIPISSNKIISVIGARRVGKTFLLFSLIQKLREKKEINRIIYINFEDDRLFPLNINEMNSFIEAYYELFPKNKSKIVYFFFDEIQVVEKWEIFVRRIYDNEKCKIFLTGSSSKLLSKEIATSLRGRTNTYEIFPYSFNEYLSLNNVSRNYYSSTNRSKIVNLYKKYFTNSGYPELLFQNNIEKQKTLNEYLNLIIYKDIVERYNISNLFLVKYLIKFFLSNTANLMSVTKIFNDIKSQGIKISKDTLFQYLEYLEEAFILFSVKISSNNIREVQRNPRKIYCIDNALTDAVSIENNYGRKFENLVFLELRRRGLEISYFKNKYEVDFVFKQNKKTSLINAAYSISNKATREREIQSLLEGMNYFNLKKGILLTDNYEEVFQSENKIINILPFWKWTLL